MKKYTYPRRISSELDEQIKQISKKNNLKYVDASKEMSRMFKKMKGTKDSFYSEIKF